MTVFGDIRRRLREITDQAMRDAERVVAERQARKTLKKEGGK